MSSANSYRDLPELQDVLNTVRRSAHCIPTAYSNRNAPAHLRRRSLTRFKQTIDNILDQRVKHYCPAQKRYRAVYISSIRTRQQIENFVLTVAHKK